MTSSKTPQAPLEMDEGKKNIIIRNARQHNLKDVCVSIPRNRLTVITGPSGSGKSSLAFDTLYAEGQRRYVESLSSYARQFLEQMPKPDVEFIEGLPPTVAIEQRMGSSNPRSTVATTTEIYDYLRALFAHVGRPFCWECNQPIQGWSVSQIADAIMNECEDRVMILAPMVYKQKGNHRDILNRIGKEGLVRIRLNGDVVRLEDVEDLSPTRQHTLEAVVDRLLLKSENRARLAESIELALRLGHGVVQFIQQAASKEKHHVYSSLPACPRHPHVRIPELSPRLFSFNLPEGACPDCGGLGTVLEFDEHLIVGNPDLSLEQGAIDAWRKGHKKDSAAYQKMLSDFSKQFEVSLEAPYRNLNSDVQRILIRGTNKKDEQKYNASFEGVIPNLQRRWERTESETVKRKLHAYLSESPCPSCKGSRLRRESLAIRIHDQHLGDVVRMNIDSAIQWCAALTLEGERAVIGKPLLESISSRLTFMQHVGVGYLTLNRSSATLSGGEAQRIRLATQLGSGLVGVCYVLDEPTIGLHPRDGDRLIRTLLQLRDLGNTVVVVEHDESTIGAAEHLIDIGPGAGEHGGEVMGQGTLKELLKNNSSLTAAYLSGKKKIPLPDERRDLNGKMSLEIKGARENNLKNIDVRIPLGGLVCVTGVSGSGKSTLVNQILLPALKRRLYTARDQYGDYDRLLGGQEIDKVVEIDQSPIGRTPRSNPATYIGVFDLIRKLYAKTREAKIRGYSHSRFSFNIKGGRCESCQGQGTRKIEMHFLPDLYVTCDACHGTRYNEETLEIRYRGKNIAQVLDMPAEEALVFFDSFSKIKQLLRCLCDVGMGYIRLGQASTTLSGGEAQRVKLASELGKSPSAHTLYVLDEPTTGLHYDDIHKLMRVLNRLVDQSNTVLIIEHNLDVIKCADWIIDLGPEGGDAGGQVIATGTPETIAACKNSYTGTFLKERLLGQGITHSRTTNTLSNTETG